MRLMAVAAGGALLGLALILGCADTRVRPSEGAEPGRVRLLEGYADQTFNPKAFVRGMEAAGPGLSIWQDPGTDLGRFDAFALEPVSTRLLPEAAATGEGLDPKRLARIIDKSLRRSLRIANPPGSGTLRLKGALVECSPGSWASRYLVGFGAAEGVAAVACEVYEPGVKRPCLRLYARQTASPRAFGGDSAAMLQHLVEQLALRLSRTLEVRIGR